MNSGFRDHLHWFTDAIGKLPALLLIASFALLPLVPSASVIIAYAAFLWLAVQNRFHYQPGRLSWRSPFPWMAALFLLHVFGMAWTSNTGFGLFDLQIKLPLFGLPILAVFIPASLWRGRDPLLFMFSISSALMVVVCTVASIARIGMGSALSPMQEIFSSYWSLVLHPSYFALYLSLGIAAWCLLPISEWLPRAASVVVLAILCLGVVLSGSKIGWMLLVPLMLALTVLRWRDTLMRNTLIGMVGLSVLGVALLIAASPFARDRVSEMLRASTEATHNAQAVTSSEVRWLTWSTAWDLFQQDPLKGTGTGDIKDELVKAYEARGYTGAAEKRLNAHNQFLQTAACLGIAGLLVIVGLFVVPLVAGRPSDPVLLLFLLLNALNQLVESMLEVQAGAVFFSLFAVLFFLREPAHDLRPQRVSDPVR